MTADLPPMLLAILLALQAAAPPIHDALSYDVTLVPSDTGGHILAEVQTAWRLGSADPVGVQLDTSMRVIRVLVDGKPNTRLSRTIYGRSAEDLVVPHEKPAGDTLSTRIRYHGFSRGGVVPGPTRGGERGAAGGGDPATVRLWLPVSEDPTDRASSSWTVQARLGQRVLASGALERVDTLPYGHATWHYRESHPAPIGRFAVAVGYYLTASVRASPCDGCAPIEVWAYPTDSGAAATAFRRAGEIADFYTGLLGPYPYSRLVHAEAAIGVEGTGSAGIALYGERAFAEGGPAELTIARETARQWLGIAVSEDSVADRRIFAGMPLYLAALWAERSGTRPLAATMRAYADALDSPASEAVRGAWTLHELRGAAGDSAFGAGLRTLYQRCRDSTASVADLGRAVSGAAGTDLSWILRQGQGAEIPALDATVARQRGRLVLTLRPASGDVRMPGLRLLVDGKPLRVNVAGPETRVPLRGFARRPARIEADPAGTWLVRIRSGG